MYICLHLTISPTSTPTFTSVYIELKHLNGIIKTIPYTSVSNGNKGREPKRDKFNCEFCGNVYHTRDAVLRHHSSCSRNSINIKPKTTKIPSKSGSRDGLAGLGGRDSSADLLQEPAEWTEEVC